MSAQRIAGRYEVVQPLGEGPLGKVYAVQDHGSDPPGREATLKILRADALDYDGLDERLDARTADLLGLRAPGINPLEHVGKTPLGLLFLASGYAAGENLRKLLARRGALPPERVGLVARGILQALAGAHAAGLPHGDLHPENVLLCDRAPWSPDDPFGTEVLLLDHGVLDLVGARRSAAHAPYVAPEQEVEANSTRTGDVFAVGAILLELLCGRRDADVEDAPPAWRDALARAIANDPAERFEDAAAFLAAVPAAEAGRAPAAEEESKNAAALARENTALYERLAALEREHDRSQSKSFGKLAERDTTLGKTREELTAARAALKERDQALSAAQGELSVAQGELEGLRARAESDAPATAGVDPKVLREAEREAGRAKAALKSSRVIAVACLLLAIVSSALWLRERGEGVVQAGATDPDPELLARAARAEAAEEELAQLREQAESLSWSEEELAAKEAEIAALAQEIETWKASERGLRADLEAKGTELVTAREEAREARRGLESASAELEETRTRAKTLEIDLGRARDPELFALDQLDRVLDALGNDDGRAARARHQALEVMNPDLAGLAGLGSLSDLALALEEAAEAGGTTAALALWEHADAALSAVRAESGALELLDAAWIRREGDRRAETIASEAERLAARHAAARDGLEARLEARWNELLNAGPDVATAEVLAIANWFEDGRTHSFLDAYARSLRATLESGSMLELPALLDLVHLDAWAEHIAAAPELAASVAGREVLLFRYAREWRTAAAEEPPPALRVVFQSADGTRPKVGWRADLALRASVADSGWPGAVGSRYIYRSAASVEGDQVITWQADEVVEAGGDTWLIDRRYYRADGALLGEETVTLERLGKRLYERERPGGALFDAANDRAYRSEYQPTVDAAPPVEICAPGPLEAFRAGRPDTEHALAYESQGLKSWWSPELGLLALESESSFRRELVFAAVR